MPAPAAGVAGVQPYDGSVLGAVTSALFDLSASSPNSNSQVAQAPLTGLGVYRSLDIYMQIQGATGGTLDMALYTSPDLGVTWVEYARLHSFAAAAAQITRRWSVSRGQQQTTIQTVSSFLNGNAPPAAPALSADTIVGGDFGDRIRLVFFAGTGTTVGAAQTIKILASP